jgi:hypothetical protein
MASVGEHTTTVDDGASTSVETLGNRRYELDYTSFATLWRLKPEVMKLSQAMRVPDGVGGLLATNTEALLPPGVPFQHSLLVFTAETIRKWPFDVGRRALRLPMPRRVPRWLPTPYGKAIVK